MPFILILIKKLLFIELQTNKKLIIKSIINITAMKPSKLLGTEEENINTVNKFFSSELNLMNEHDRSLIVYGIIEIGINQVKNKKLFTSLFLESIETVLIKYGIKSKKLDELRKMCQEISDDVANEYLQLLLGIYYDLRTYKIRIVSHFELFNLIESEVSKQKGIKWQEVKLCLISFKKIYDDLGSNNFGKLNKLTNIFINKTISNGKIYFFITRGVNFIKAEIASSSMQDHEINKLLDKIKYYEELCKSITVHDEGEIDLYDEDEKEVEKKQKDVEEKQKEVLPMEELE